MDTELNTVRLLGAAQLIVFLASMISERALASAVGTGSTSDKLVSISNHLSLMRISNLAALINSLAIVVLAVLFYVTLQHQNKVIAMVALAWFVAEAIILALSKIGTLALIPLSQSFVEAGTPDSGYFQTLGDFLYHGVDRRGYDIHMLFFAMGGILWYYLLYASAVVPRALSIWGLVAICLLTIPVVLVLYNRNLTQAMILALPYAPFEPVLGIWLILKGFT